MSQHHGDAALPGERVLEALPDSDAGLVFIGTLETPFKRREDCPKQGDPENGPVCQAWIAAPFLPALDGLDAYETLQVLYWLDRARRDLLTLARRGGDTPRGAFAMRSPVRPNPIGVSNVRLLRRDGDRLWLRGLDCLDGTPLVDIKPDRCAFSRWQETQGAQ